MTGATPKPTLIVHGPQGCGKSINAQRLMRKLGLRSLVDDWLWHETIPTHGALVLTYEPPPPGTLYPHVMSFKEAMRACGFDRPATPTPRGRE